jgi:hypothetical protein
MRKKRVTDKEELRHVVTIRVKESKYEELTRLMAKTSHSHMSHLVRDILHNRPVKIFTRDQTLDNTMEELARLRTEIRAIGVNINQITRYFNTYPEPRRKAFYAKMAFEQYQAIEPKIDRLLEIISKLSKKWLSG